LPDLLAAATIGNKDIVVATRRSHESRVAGLNFLRNTISKVLDLVARFFFPKQLRGVSDPLTGFFLIRTNAINLQGLKPKGFKILLEILVRNPHLKKSEVPFSFGERFAGQSKASAKEVVRYLNLLWVLRFGENSLRFLGFALVGLSGVLVNSFVLYLTTDLAGIYYLYSSVIATAASSLWNFTLYEVWIYRSMRNNNNLSTRLGIFLIMNLAALALRAPLMYLFTSVLGIHYIVSNLISIGLLTIARFFLADNVIWTNPKSKIPLGSK
jgi:dolichol-phosphate mannosyltransferase